MKKLLIYSTVIVTVLVGIVSCNNDFNTLGGDILGQEQLAGRIQKADFDVVAYNALLNPVQTNNFQSMLLGTYNDPVYGKTTYDFVSQVNLTSSAIDFGDNGQIDSVFVEIPYFSTATNFDGEETEYELDSIYGSQPFRLEIFENGFFFNNFDAQNPTQPARFFNDLTSRIENNIVSPAPLYSQDNFLPSRNEVQLETENSDGDISVTQRLTPRLRAELDLDYMRSRFLLPDNSTNPNLQDNNLFLNYFRGLYFKVTQLNPALNGSLISLNINEAQLKIHFTSSFQDIADINDNGDTNELIEVPSLDILSFNGTKVNMIVNDLNPTIITEIQSADDTINGEENLFLKGGEGSMAFLELFGPDLDMDGEADALTQLKEQNIILNDALLNFYVDQSRVTPGISEPERIVIFNAENNNVLADYLFANDQFSPINSVLGHLGRLEREDNEDESSSGVKYQIRITEHLRNIIGGDQENVRLAVAVSQNVQLIQNSNLLIATNPASVDAIPLGSAYSHEGTVLHGNLSPDPEKRLKLELYYTPIEE